MTAHRGFDDPFPPVHPLPSLPSSRFHLRLKIQRHDSSRNWAHKLSVNILQKIVHVLVARLLLTWARDSAPRPNQAVRFFCPELSSKSGSWGEDTRWLTKKAKLPVFTHDDSKQVTKHVSTAKNARIKGSVSITNRDDRDGEGGGKEITRGITLFFAGRIGKEKKVDAKFSRGWKFVLFCN